MEVENIKSKIITVQGQQVILDSDVAELYGVETKRVNEAVKNNPDKFPEGYIISLTTDEMRSLRSKNPTLNEGGRGQHAKYNAKAFSERG
ncbi:MAG: ORF6N domain-containing protein, partial [Culturomica sp.]|nr:ORF6N domain-containing protein [Culturomica sp.]